MTREEALARLDAIVEGMDQDSTDHDGGWWETRVGAAFGAHKKTELEQLIVDLT